MGPRSPDRGIKPKQVFRFAVFFASMMPRPRGRGNDDLELQEKPEFLGFNDATAARPSKYVRQISTPRLVKLASMLPRPRGRGNTNRRAIHASTSPLQ